ncbi:MAG: FHA domain-containing protein [Candidatus Viridilinea halotolerans]|uniref:FHA domain-containing protein n=1 Tax=Candidatus Viridilinea halotolerans TaxID=2491704 RepID=A0A426TUB7_9CHLR|nr:MAG: FHA domain-containing protein [Candidatus Viridilinea halotolerans]
MSSAPRLELHIDVFAKPDQVAMALSTLTPNELIEAILSEFARDLEYLSEESSDYKLVRRDDGTPLQDDLPIQQHVKNGTALRLIERDLPIPMMANRPSQAIYLRETSSQRLYKLHWLPAVIGRRDASVAATSPLLAVDLGSYSNGLRVSRHHAVISEGERSAHYTIENLARSNSVVVLCENKRVTLGQEERHQLQHGDTIYLPNSELSFKFIIRDV